MDVSLEEAARLLADGQVVAVPTETVYGLAAALNQPAAINQIFNLKGRPSNNPLIIHADDVLQVLPFILEIPKKFIELTQAFWPGPLTLVVPIDEERVPQVVRAGLPTAAFRIPNHPMARTLIQKVGPIVMPSANISGRPSATCPGHVETDFGEHFPVVDGGTCGRGLESTILFYRDRRWHIIRLGALAAEAFADVLGYVPNILQPERGKAPICPGQLYRHYAPKAKIVLRPSIEDCQGVVVGFSDRQYPQALRVLNLGPITKPESVAENLYATLRQLDHEGHHEVSVDMNIPSTGLWETIKERLKKASGT